MGVAVEHELTCHVFGQALEGSHVLGAEVAEDECGELVGVHSCHFGLMASEEFVEFGDEALDLGDEFDEAFGDEDRTEVVAFGCTCCHDACDVVDYVGEAHVACFDFLGDEADVGLGLKSALEGDVACRAAHQFDEVPVFLGRVAVTLDVADDFGVYLGGGVEAERSLDDVVLEVAVDGLGAADDLNAGVVGLVVLGKDCGVGVRVVAADDDESGDAELAEDDKTFLELVYFLELGAA